MTAVRHSRAAVFLFLILKMRISGRFRAMEIRIFRYMRGASPRRTLPSYLQHKMVFLRVKQPLSAHFSELERQTAALDRKIICKLLP